jgi:hypothetical protein
VRFYFSIISCNKNIDKLNTLRNTWIQDINKNNFKYNFYVGNGHTDKDIVSLDCEDGYEFLRYKTFKMLEYAYNNIDFDFIVKTDDDTFVDVDNLIDFDIKEYEYIGNFSTFNNFLKNKEGQTRYIKNRSLNQDLSFSYVEQVEKDFGYAEGGFYILSRSAIKKILNYIKENNKIFDIIQEDIFIGFIASQLKLKSLNIGYTIPWYDISNNNISFHPVENFLMKKLSKVESFKDRINLLTQYLLKNKYYKNGQ